MLSEAFIHGRLHARICATRWFFLNHGETSLSTACIPAFPQRDCGWSHGPHLLPGLDQGITWLLGSVRRDLPAVRDVPLVLHGIWVLGGWGPVRNITASIIQELLTHSSNTCPVEHQKEPRASWTSIWSDSGSEGLIPVPTAVGVASGQHTGGYPSRGWSRAACP